MQLLTEEIVNSTPEVELGCELTSILSPISDTKRSYINTPLPALSEAYSRYTWALDKISNNDNEFDGNLRMNYLLNFNLAMGESLYALSILVTSANIDESSVINYYETLLKERGLYDAIFFNGHPIQTVMNYARNNNIMAQVYNNPDLNLRPIKLGVHQGDNFYKGGKIITPVYTQIYGEQLWQVTHALNSLSSIPALSDTQKYQESIMELWLQFFKLMDLLGYCWDSVTRVYSVYHNLRNNIITNNK
jgi:hypothetical protein